MEALKIDDQKWTVDRLSFDIHLRSRFLMHPHTHLWRPSADHKVYWFGAIGQPAKNVQLGDNL